MRELGLTDITTVENLQRELQYKQMSLQTVPVMQKVIFRWILEFQIILCIYIFTGC